jgi:hypothetical protein
MRAGRPALLALLGLAAGSPLRADSPDAHALIARCAQEADSTLRGLDALRVRCPGIEQALYQLGLEQLLPSGWQKDLSPSALADFDALVSRYAGRHSEATRLDASRLRSIARSLEPPPSPVSWWEQLRAWIRTWFEPVSGEAPAWLRFFSRFHITSTAWRVILVLLAASVTIVAAAVVVIELRAARARPRRRSRFFGSKSSAGPASAADGSSSLANLDSAPPHDRPVLLLRALVEALTRTHRLRRDKDLTCRELVAEARFDTARQREDFEHVAVLAERALYGRALAPFPAMPDEVVRSARALHDQLLIAPASTGEGEG